jgi:MOSC domain-containing protein YiiM
MEVDHLSIEQIELGMSDVLASPLDDGRLEAIVIRPGHNQREYREAGYLSPTGGLEGDRWATTKGNDGRPNPDAQISLMNSRLLKMIAGEEERMALAGDNLIVDLDLSETNMPAGQRFSVGEVLLEVTDLAHTGCGKFAERFGPNALRYINAAKRRPLHLRGIFARVLKAGTVRVGDVVQKVE